MDDFDVIFGILIVVSALSGICTLIYHSLNNKCQNDNRKIMASLVGKLTDFNSTQQLISFDGMSGIAIDNQRKKVCLLKNNTQKIYAQIINFNDIISSEIHEDGQTTSRTSRSSQIGGTLVGGLLLGGVGAVIGGLSGNTIYTDKIHKIELIITVNDTLQPLHIITFLNVELAKNSTFYNQIINGARHWHAIIDVIIKQSDIETHLSHNNNIDNIKEISNHTNEKIMQSSENSIEKIKFSCPKCDKSLSVSKEFFGKTGECPNCKHNFTAPSI